jgi:hypothetical protein
VDVVPSTGTAVLAGGSGSAVNVGGGVAEGNNVTVAITLIGVGASTTST